MLYLWESHAPRVEVPALVAVVRVQLLNASLAVCLIFVIAMMLLPFAVRAPQASSLAAFAVVTLPAALLHSLSTGLFRWTYDANPLVPVALAAAFYILLRVLAFVSKAPVALRTTVTAATVLTVFALQATLWTKLFDKLDETRRCTESWPEVHHLAGARLAKSAAGMRELVSRVRTASSTEETVLLLPNDPNVEAWFERPRPSLSSSIVFPDQYWDRYVEDDIERLKRSLPKVVVIGPRQFWKGLQAWNPGAQRFAKKVEDEILPTRYSRQPSQRIGFFLGVDSMDVYVRNGPP
jgi:hypothetical protein